MTYELKGKKQKKHCLMCNKEIHDAERGAPKKYCKECSQKAQRSMDLKNKEKKRKWKQAEKLLEKSKDNPHLISELKEKIDDLEILENESNQAYLKLFSRTSLIPTELEEVSKSPFYDKPKKWSQRELVKLIKNVLDDRKAK